MKKFLWLVMWDCAPSGFRTGFTILLCFFF